MKTKFISLIAGLALVIFFAGCAQEENQEVERPTASEEPAAGSGQDSGDTETAEVTEEDGVQVVEINVDDTMQFGEERFEVPAGAEVRLVLRHTGNLPAQAMGHNVVILQQEVDTMEFSMAAARAAANDYIPEDRADEVIAHTEVIGGGEETEITFTAPEEAGEYTYICSFPGHVAAGMTGIMVVQ